VFAFTAAELSGIAGQVAAAERGVPFEHRLDGIFVLDERMVRQFNRETGLIDLSPSAATDVLARQSDRSASSSRTSSASGSGSGTSTTIGSGSSCAAAPHGNILESHQHDPANHASAVEPRNRLPARVVDVSHASVRSLYRRAVGDVSWAGRM
jgi:hypothetical protein